LRTDMVRSLVTTCVGAGAACVGAAAHLFGMMGAGKCVSLELFGGALAMWTLMGLPFPGAVPFLKVKTPTGFHCAETKRNTRLRNTFEAWMSSFTPTPYLTSGEWSTVLPFVWTPNKAKNMSYERIWVKSTADGEHVACDWVFPPGGHDPARPTVLLLTGLAPDTHWTEAGGFVANTAWHLAHKCNMTAVVLVARGTMDTDVREHLFHGARTQDAREAILAMRRALLAARGSGEEDSSRVALPLFASGFSMGAVIISNYCGKFGDDCRLAGVVHFSGMYDGLFNMTFDYPAQTWQAYLAYGLKANLLTGRIARIALSRGVDMPRVMSRKVANIIQLDDEFTAVFNGYKGGVKEYYGDMGLASHDKWKNVKAPVLAICAQDDPITHCDSFHAEEFAAGNHNLLFLVTRYGGHVGWPWGMRPWERGFDFMSEGISVFVEAMVSSD